MRPILIVAADQDYFCRYCEHKMGRYEHIPGLPIPRDTLTQDHMTPRVLGGRTTVDNLVAACHQCNFMRGEVDMEAFANIVGKWFKRDPFLWIRWHEIPWEEVLERKRHCVRVQERRLRGKARRHVHVGYHHFAFVQRESRHLAAAR
jgi:hypothetical protein